MGNVAKTGILTFHYSTNYGGVLQSYALYKVLDCYGANVELINYVPSTYSGQKVYRNIGLKTDFNLKRLFQRMRIKHKYCQKSIWKFDRFRETSVRLSTIVDELTIGSL